MEYAGAVYHVMSRGDRGGKIFRDRLDYEGFDVAMKEVCERTGWRVHAWVGLPNHFHWLLETPESNLVAGMKWFLGAYSQRFNARHGQRGHVFQGRYKALPIETDSGGYFETVSTYIHLNPVRAGLLEEGEGLETYALSSYGHYLAKKGGRPPWLRVDRVLGNLGLRDTPQGRRAYRDMIEGRVREWRTAAGRKAFKAAWKPVRFGWFVGGDGFKEELLKRVGSTVEGRNRASYGGEGIREHDAYRAETVIRKGIKRLDVREADLARLPKGHEAKCLLAWLAHSQTMVSHQWLSDRLHLGHATMVSLYIKRVKQARTGPLSQGKKALLSMLS